MIFVIIIIFFILSPSLYANYSINTLLTNERNNNSPRKLSITEINSPDIIINSYSKFQVNVTIKNNIDKSCKFKISAYIENDEMPWKFAKVYSDIKIYTISPYKTKNITLDCEIGKNSFYFLFHHLLDISDKLLTKGSLVIKIKQIYPVFPIFDSFSLGNWIIKRKSVSFIDPIIYDNPIKINWFDIPINTDCNGSFNVCINITNNFNINVSIFTLVILRSETIVGVINRDWTKVIEYPCGFFENIIKKKSHINSSINCSFPNENFIKQYYRIYLVVYCYIPTDGNYNTINEKCQMFKFAHYFLEEFTFRSTTRESIELLLPCEFKIFYNKFLKNVPTYYNKPFHYSCDFDYIYYNKTNPWVKNIEDTIEEGIEKTINLIPYIYAMSISLILLMGFIYWIIKRKY